MIIFLYIFLFKKSNGDFPAMFVYQMFTDTTYQMFPALRGPSALGSGVGLPLSFLLTFFEGKAHTQVAPSMHQNVPNRPNLFPEYDWLDWNSGFFIVDHISPINNQQGCWAVLNGSLNLHNPLDPSMASK
jgi:hypothetical protein